MIDLADRFESAVGEIVSTVSSASGQLEAAANSLTRTAENTQSLSANVAAASEEASANVQSVASATEEMSSSVSEIARQVQESSDIAKEAVQQAEKTDARINQLSQAAARIGDVVDLISAVAQQTNLLALNATIEAARAGEAGKGFAVVAQEVKALAAQTAKATEEISTQIASMQSATQDSVVAIKDISGTINRISDIASAIAAAVEEQGAATQQISRNVQQAASGTTQVASSISEVNQGAAETGAASAQLLSSAQSLSGESGRLKVEVERFLATVRAAERPDAGRPRRRSRRGSIGTAPRIVYLASDGDGDVEAIVFRHHGHKAANVIDRCAGRGEWQQETFVRHDRPVLLAQQHRPEVRLSGHRDFAVSRQRIRAERRRRRLIDESANQRLTVNPLKLAAMQLYQKSKIIAVANDLAQHQLFGDATKVAVCQHLQGRHPGIGATAFPELQK